MRKFSSTLIKLKKRSEQNFFKENSKYYLYNLVNYNKESKKIPKINSKNLFKKNNSIIKKNIKIITDNKIIKQKSVIMNPEKNKNKIKIINNLKENLNKLDHYYRRTNPIFNKYNDNTKIKNTDYTYNREYFQNKKRLLNRTQDKTPIIIDYHWNNKSINIFENSFKDNSLNKFLNLKKIKEIKLNKIDISNKKMNLEKNNYIQNENEIIFKNFKKNIKNQNIKYIKKLLNNINNVIEKVDYLDRNLLILSVISNNNRIFEIFIKFEFNLNHKDIKGNTILNYAIFNENIKMILTIILKKNKNKIEYKKTKFPNNEIKTLLQNYDKNNILEIKKKYKNELLLINFN